RGGQADFPFYFLDEMFELRTSDSVLNFKVKFPAKDFIKLTATRQYIILQFEFDSALHVLHPEGTFPQNPPPIQPEGFPLTPITVTELNDPD
ncbi:MAG: hypothetical protein HQL51_10145, partial [Magnetococcales bacterium]|nr:hypothetical protein [Magnetococcales bacterium]